MIRLFSRTADKTTSFVYSQGLGILNDAISCIVTEERNGAYELTMEYPINGYKADSISLQSFLLVKPNPYDDPQPFRIYSITQQIDGVMTINAAHLSYDLSSQISLWFNAVGADTAVTKLDNSIESIYPNRRFRIYTDMTTSGTITVNVPTTVRSLLADGENSLVGVFGGELEFDYWDVYLRESRGLDRGVVVRYGKNVTEFDYEKTADSETYDCILPYWYSEEDGLVMMSDPNSNDYSFDSCLLDIDWPSGGMLYKWNSRILVLDLSSEFSEKPTASDLRSKAKNYISVNDLVGGPKESLQVSFVPLTGKNEVIKLCDTVTVKNDMLDISLKTKVVKTVYDAIADRYDSIELDNSPSLLTSTISKLT